MPFWRRKTIQERLAEKEKKDFTNLRKMENPVVMDRLRMKQYNAEIKEVKRVINESGLRSFLTKQGNPWMHMEGIIREFEKTPVSINEAKKILVKNGLAGDDLTAGLQVEALLNKKVLPATEDHGIRLVPVQGVGGEVKYKIERYFLKNSF